jgi:hypothetical protein
MVPRVLRREFLDGLALGAAGLAVGATAKSYGQIIGSNDRLNIACGDASTRRAGRRMYKLRQRQPGD